MSEVMPIYVGDYLADTMHLSTEEHGAYFLLLMAMNRAGNSLPYEDERLARITRVSDARWATIKNAVLGFFSLQDGTVTHGRSRLHAVRRERRPVAAALRQEVFERDGARCAYCGTEEGPFELDHIFPFARGGSDDALNLTPACQPCNRSKRDKPLGEWRQ